MQQPNSELTARELVLAIRGKRTQTALSRTLGYRSNIAHRWEVGECFPTAAVFLKACAQLKPSRKRLFVSFLKQTPSWLDPQSPFAPAQVAAFLRELRGKTPLKALAERSGYNRYQITRWLSGKTQPKLPEFLSFIEAASRRMLDFIAELCDPALLPSAAKAWAQLSRAREAAYASPLSHAVLHALELEGYRAATPDRRLAFLARSLGVSIDVVKSSLEVLRDVGQVRKARGYYEPVGARSIDTSHDPSRTRGLKVAWAEVALQRMRRGDPGSFGYSVFAVSRHDLTRIRELHLEYVRAMQTIVATSQPNECVALYCTQLFDMGASA